MNLSIPVLILLCVAMLGIGFLLGRRRDGERDLLRAPRTVAAPRRPVAASPSVTEAPADLEHEVRRLLGQGGKIVAIKYAREVTGLGLKEAKELVEEIESRG